MSTPSWALRFIHKQPVRLIIDNKCLVPNGLDTVVQNSEDYCTWGKAEAFWRLLGFSFCPRAVFCYLVIFWSMVSELLSSTSKFSKPIKFTFIWGILSLAGRLKFIKVGQKRQKSMRRSEQLLSIVPLGRTTNLQDKVGKNHGSCAEFYYARRAYAQDKHQNPRK